MAAYPCPLVSVQVTSSQGPPPPHRPFPSVHSLSYDHPLCMSVMALTTCGLTCDVCAHLYRLMHCVFTSPCALFVHVLTCARLCMCSPVHCSCMYSPVHVYACAHLCVFIHCLCTHFLCPIMSLPPERTPGGPRCSLVGHRTSPRTWGRGSCRNVYAWMSRWLSLTETKHQPPSNAHHCPRPHPQDQVRVFSFVRVPLTSQAWAL